MGKQPEKKILSTIAIILGVVALVLSWIPFINNFAAIVAVIGFIFAIIALVVNRKHKKVFAWIGLAISVLAFALVLGIQSTYEDSFNDVEEGATGTASSTASSENKKSNDKTVTVDGLKYDYKDSKTYKVNYSDSSWNIAKMTVNSVTVYKLDDGYEYDSANDGEFDIDGFVSINMTINANQDVNAYPTQSTVSFDNGEQHESDTGTWDGEIASGVTKSGNVVVPITSLDKSDSISTMRLKFDADILTEDSTDAEYEDENSEHSYDMTIDLNK